MSALISRELVRLDAQLGDTAGDVIDALSRVVTDAGRSTDAAWLASDVRAREAKTATGMPGGLAIPHCRSEHVTTPSLAFARLAPAVDFGAKDGPADLVFLIAAPATGDELHMKLLTQLARALVRTDFTDALRGAETDEEVVSLVDAVVQVPDDRADAPTADQIVAETDATAGADRPGGAAEPAPGTTAEPATILAVTACPTGIAHTFMAAEALEEAGRRAGVRLLVEPQGSVGATRIDPAEITSAAAVIFATDVGVRDRDRFAGLPLVSGSVKDGIHHADDLVARANAAASDPDAERVSRQGSAEPEDSGSRGGGAGTQGALVRARTALLTGVSYMIPFVAAGGLLIALAFLLGGVDVDPAYATSNSLARLPDGTGAMFDSGLLMYLGAVLMLIGQAAFGLFIPALAGYIAYAVADRPGIAPGFVVGLLCSGEAGIPGGLNGNGAGFIGAIVGGFLAGVVAAKLAGLRVPHFVRGLMPVVIIPLVATLVAGGIMLVVLGRPLGWLTTELQDGLTSMSGGQAVLLGVILGLMMCFDLGGPVNKAAYAFGVAGLEAGTPASHAVMATVMVTGMVPPLALALASTMRGRLFTEPERENGRAAWLLGASFISEGAIPFAAADPLRVIPAMMTGGAVAGGIAMAFDVQQNVPHGGVFVLFAIDGVLGWLIALAAGTLVAAAAVIALKQLAHRRGDTAEDVAEPATA